MNTQKRFAVITLSAFLAVVGVAPPARADMGIPMLAFIWPVSWVLLIPVVAIEAWIATRILNISWWPAIKVAGAANLVTTFVGIPITWVAMLVVEFTVAPLLSLTKPGSDWLNHDLALVLIMPAWMPPVNYQLFWPIPAACLVLCIPLFAMSAWCEGRIARRMLGSGQEVASIKWGWRANLASYVPIVLLVAYWLIRSIITHQTMYG